MKKVYRPLLVLPALIFLFEAWLWDHLAPLVRWVVERIPLARLKERIAAVIERLPPYPTLLVFILPILVLLPLKILALWLLAHQHWVFAIERLDRSLLIHAEYCRVCRWIQIQPDHVRRFWPTLRRE